MIDLLAMHVAGADRADQGVSPPRPEREDDEQVSTVGIAAYRVQPLFHGHTPIRKDSRIVHQRMLNL
nr:hypothetical protein [Glycocaulis alkaliphilus]